MPYVLLQYDVEDYNQWKAAFDANEDTRDEHGCTGGFVMHAEDDPNSIGVVLTFESPEEAHAMIESGNLVQDSNEVAIKGNPTISVYRHIDHVDG